MPHTQDAVAKRRAMDQKDRIATRLIETLSDEAKSNSRISRYLCSSWSRTILPSDTRSFLTGATVKRSPAPRKATEVQLAAGSLLRMDGSSRGVRVVCRSGLCWITQEGDSRDYLLEHKQNFTIDQDGVVVVQALADTEILVSPE